MQLSLQAKLIKIASRLKGLNVFAVGKHHWSPEEVSDLVNKYRDWSKQAGPEQAFSLKDFILSMRQDYPFFQELPDSKFYERIKRTLYRSLSKAGVAWKHAGKKKIKPEEQTPEIAAIIHKLEQHGVGIATDGAVLLIFPVRLYTHESEDGYFLPTIPHAINHLRNLITNTENPTSEIVEEARLVIPLLQQFIAAWKKEPEKEKLFNPNIKRNLPTGEYSITQDPLNSDLHKVKKMDGTVYICDTKNHTCTCPAGQAGRNCKHLSTLLFESTT